MHTGDTGQSNRDYQVPTEPIALSNIIQTSATPIKMISHTTSGSFVRVTYAPVIAPDLPIGGLPKEAPMPVSAFQMDEYPALN
jgi:hypothetical protein